jgi:hypothetical protein
MFGRGWEPGTATIVAVRYDDTGFSPSGSRAEFVGDVQADSGASLFRATFKAPLRGLNFLEPSVGQSIRVRIHSKNAEVEIDTDDAGVRRDAAQEREQEQFQALAAAPPGTGLSGSPPAPEPEVQSALTEVSAAVAGLSEATAGVAETIAAIKRAREAGDLAEVERLKADFQRRSDERRPKPGS